MNIKKVKSLHFELQKIEHITSSLNNIESCNEQTLSQLRWIAIRLSKNYRLTIPKYSELSAQKSIDIIKSTGCWMPIDIKHYQIIIRFTPTVIATAEARHLSSLLHKTDATEKLLAQVSALNALAVNEEEYIGRKWSISTVDTINTLEDGYLLTCDVWTWEYGRGEFQSFIFHRGESFPFCENEIMERWCFSIMEDNTRFAFLDQELINLINIANISNDKNTSSRVIDNSTIKYEISINIFNKNLGYKLPEFQCSALTIGAMIGLPTLILNNCADGHYIFSHAEWQEYWDDHSIPFYHRIPILYAALLSATKRTVLANILVEISDLPKVVANLVIEYDEVMFHNHVLETWAMSFLLSGK